MPRRQTSPVSQALSRQGWTIEKAANKTGLSSFTVSGAKKGEMSPETRTALARALSVPPNSLGPITKLSKIGSKPTVRRSSPRIVGKPNVNGRRILCDEQHGSWERPAEIDQTLSPRDEEILLMALFRSRKAKGFNTAEAEAVKNWASKVRRDSSVLNSVLQGKVSIDVSGQGIKILGQPQSGCSQQELRPFVCSSAITESSQRNIPDFSSMLNMYLEWGRKQGWKSYYLKEKKCSIKLISREMMALPGSMSAGEKFQRVIKQMRRGRAFGTIKKVGSTFCAFFAWAKEHGLIVSNPFEGLGTASALRNAK
jgi:lambda repressor-like predicted transcriptional regulator